MPRRKEQIGEPNRPYHIVGNALDHKGIFESAKDCSRFIFQMHAANVGSPAPNMQRIQIEEVAKQLLRGEQISSKLIQVEHEPLVELFSFALVRDHYHFGLVPTSKGSIQKYMQKLNLGFAKYFNLKYNRRGALFATRFLAAPVKNPAQLHALIHHINIKNVLDVYQPNWEKKGFLHEDNAIEFLGEYPYSSFLDVFSKRSSALLSESAKKELKKFIKEKALETKEEYKKIFEAYKRNQLGRFEHIFLDSYSGIKQSNE